MTPHDRGFPFSSDPVVLFPAPSFVNRLYGVCMMLIPYLGSSLL